MKKYTEDEILELGRQALKRLGIKVFVIHYTHKHGDDISVFGGEKTAQEAALALMIERVSEWDPEDRIKFDGCENFDDQLTVFHQVEKEVSYGETIEIMERTVQ
jgi:hypothetical protein